MIDVATLAAPSDPTFAQPHIDVDETRSAPVADRYVHGGFTGTDTRFSYYFPPAEQYRGRFFQHVTPVPDSEHLAQSATGEEDRIRFSVESGAYFVETNGGGSGATAGPEFAVDPTVGVYRANAACAEFSRSVAAAVYGPHRPYGYVYGGSGGGFRVIGCAENTTGVWDGFVPYVIGSPVAIPNVFTVRMHALRVLHDVFELIVDAYDAGGSGDPMPLLDDAQRAALREVTSLGFPPRSWFAWRTMGPHAFSLLFQGMCFVDPTYFEDFWTTPGYLGHDAPETLHDARITHRATVVGPVTAEEARAAALGTASRPGEAHGDVDTAWKAQVGDALVGFRLDALPRDVDYLLGELVVESGPATGTTVLLREVDGDTVVLDAADPRLADVRPGDVVRIDNSKFLASQTYHRHQDPGTGYPAWDQFRDVDGRPMYPQRLMLLGPLFTKGASGTVPTGRFTGRMIVVESLLDREAYPWQADWYRTQATLHFGEGLDDAFRLWFTDNALHGDSALQEHPTRTVSYLGVLHQALRDLAQWVEDDVAPPASTTYRVTDAEVLVPASASERLGVQPVVEVTVNGSLRAEVGVGDTVSVHVRAEVPPGAGSVVNVELCVGLGSGDAAEFVPLGFIERPAVAAITAVSFSRPGTYFVTARVASHRDGDSSTPYARLQNLARARLSW